MIARKKPVERETALRATDLITWCGMAMFVASPLLSPFLLAGCCLIAAFWHWYDGGSRRQIAWQAIAPAAAMAAWFALAVAWSPDKRAGAWAAFLIALAIVLVVVTLPMLEGLSSDVRRRIGRAFVLAIGFVMVLSLEEEVTGLFVRRAINSLVPLSQNSIVARLDSGWVTQIQSYITNKNIAVCLMMTWPMLLVSRSVARTQWWMILRLLAAAAFVGAVVLSDYETGKLAVAVGILVFALARMAPRAAIALVTAGWIGATVLALPASLLAYKTGIYNDHRIQFSGRHRLVIWGYTSQKVLKAPAIGYGLASTRVLDEGAKPDGVKLTDGTNIPLATNMHSHNIFIQAYHETGLIGGLLMMLAGMPILAWLRRRPPASAPYLLAAFATTVTIASLSWSLVAPWYIAAFAMTALWMRFAADYAASERPPAAAVALI